MMPFFFTMPISRMTPISAMMEKLDAGGAERDERAETRRRQGRDDGQRMCEALVEHAQHDVDGDQRREDEQRLLRGLLREGRRVARRLAAQSRRCMHLRHRLVDVLQGVVERVTGAGIVGNGDGREGPLVVDDEGGCILRRLDDAQQRNLCAVPSRHVDVV